MRAVLLLSLSIKPTQMFPCLQPRVVSALLTRYEWPRVLAAGDVAVLADVTGSSSAASDSLPHVLQGSEWMKLDVTQASELSSAIANARTPTELLAFAKRRSVADAAAERVHKARPAPQSSK